MNKSFLFLQLIFTSNYFSASPAIYAKIEKKHQAGQKQKEPRRRPEGIALFRRLLTGFPPCQLL